MLWKAWFAATPLARLNSRGALYGRVQHLTPRQSRRKDRGCRNQSLASYHDTKNIGSAGFVPWFLVSRRRWADNQGRDTVQRNGDRARDLWSRRFDIQTLGCGEWRKLSQLFRLAGGRPGGPGRFIQCTPRGWDRRGCFIGHFRRQSIGV